MTPHDETELAEQGRGLRRLARALVGDAATADDVVQEAYVLGLRRGGVGRSAWLRGVVRNKVRERRRSESRRAARERGAPVPPTGSSAEDTAAQIEQQGRVMAALGRVPEPFRTAVWLRYIAGHEPRAIADALGVPSATVRTRVHRGLEHLREQLDAGQGGDRGAWTLLLMPLAAPQLPLAPPVVPTPATAAASKPGLSALVGALATVAALVGCLALTGVFGGEPAAEHDAVGGAHAERAIGPGLEGLDDATAVAPPSTGDRLLRGHVRAEGADLPDGVQVYVIRKDAQFHTRPVAHVAPEADGRFALEVGSTESCWIAGVSADGAFYGAVDGDVWSPERPLTLRLAPAPVRTVRVLDRDGDPITNALVWFLPLSEGEVRRTWPRPGDDRLVTMTAVTDERGIVDVRVPTNGGFRLRIRDRGPVAERVVAAGETRIDFQLERGGTVRVVLEGWQRALPEFEGRLERVGDPGALRRRGRFEEGVLFFDNVPRGRWRVVARARTWTTSTSEVVDVVRPDEIVEVATAVRRRYDIGSVALEMFDRNGQPLSISFYNSWAWLRERTAEAPTWRLRRPDAWGRNRLVFRGLAHGTYDLFVACPSRDGAISGLTSEIQVVPHQELVVGMRLHPATRRSLPDLGAFPVAHRRLVHAELGELPVVVSRQRRTHPDDGLPLEGSEIGPYPVGAVSLELWDPDGRRKVVDVP